MKQLVLAIAGVVMSACSTLPGTAQHIAGIEILVPGGSPDELEQLIAGPLERQLIKQLPDARRIWSSIREGAVSVEVAFDAAPTEQQFKAVQAAVQAASRIDAWRANSIEVAIRPSTRDQTLAP